MSVTELNELKEEIEGNDINNEDQGSEELYSLNDVFS